MMNKIIKNIISMKNSCLFIPPQKIFPTFKEDYLSNSGKKSSILLPGIINTSTFVHELSQFKYWYQNTNVMIYFVLTHRATIWQN